MHYPAETSYTDRARHGLEAGAGGQIASALTKNQLLAGGVRLSLLKQVDQPALIPHMLPTKASGGPVSCPCFFPRLPLPRWHAILGRQVPAVRGRVPLGAQASGGHGDLRVPLLLRVLWRGERRGRVDRIRTRSPAEGSAPPAAPPDRIETPPLQDSAFDDLFAHTLVVLEGALTVAVSDCHDAIGLLCMIRLTYQFQITMSRRRVPALDGYFDRVNLLLWPRFKQVLDGHMKGIKAAAATMAPPANTHGEALGRMPMLGPASRLPSPCPSSRDSQLSRRWSSSSPTWCRQCTLPRRTIRTSRWSRCSTGSEAPCST